MIMKLQAKVISITNFSPCDDPDHFYIGPDRTDFILEPINCTLKSFVELFDANDSSYSFVPISGGVSDIGGGGLNIEVGSVLTTVSNGVTSVAAPLDSHDAIQFSTKKSNLDSQIDKACDVARSEIKTMVRQAKMNLGLLASIELDDSVLWADVPF